MSNIEFNKVIKKINSWYSKRNKVLNIKTRPYNDLSIFTSLINKVLNDNGKIIYVFSKETKDIDKKDSYKLQGTINTNKNNINFIGIDKIAKMKEPYDLAIFDDITYFSQISVGKLREAVEEIYWRTKKIVICSCEKVFPIGEEYELLHLTINTPIIEPRHISTRIRLEEDIPLTLYDYLKWFKEQNKNALIVVPPEEKINNVYNSYYNILKKDGIRVVKYIEGQSVNFIKEILQDRDEAIFIITNYIDDYIRTIDSLNVVILFSENQYFSYKRILYLCSALEIKEEVIPEILLVSRDITSNVDDAKNITRRYNKRLWDKRSRS